MASTKDWFESVAEAQRRARRRLPRSVYSAVVAGSERGATLSDNVQAFREIGFLPRIATGIGQGRDLTTTMLGQHLQLPVMISPTGVQAVHPEAEVAVARAAASARTAMGLSSFASKPLGEVIEANPATFFQIYWMGRDRVAEILEAVRGRVPGIILTLDWTFAHRRDWGSPAIPQTLDLRTILKLAPQTVVRPQWLREFARAGGPPPLTVPNMARPGEVAPKFFDAYVEWMQSPPVTWSDLAWVREHWNGKLMIKGITHPDDSRRAVDIGADAISVSNHGGNNLDGTPGSIRALPAVVDAVDGRIEILLDGGIRRGSDVVKAVALGARAVMIGRAALWGLAANGEAGVANVLEILRAGIDETLVGLGKQSVTDLGRADLLIAESFSQYRASGEPTYVTDAPLA